MRDFIGEVVTLKIDTVTNEAAVVHEGAVIRAMTLLPPHAHRIDRRDEDTRSLRKRWDRENTPKTPETTEPPSDAETERLHRLRATMVEIRHPAAYDDITEYSA